ncbi:hypothetical protein CUROG_00630 [Corynebacterium urogenitale]|uniref:Uncharacterized protein n=1 Tax=Corynebacterium urogenitale TaxID=2487892 RepID=A0A5J6Z9C0_9CORY|nr:DUF6339 family protein [Corynebacterium urogenitale]QFQ01530.1 hypothetical protein CUROG_00630 [Corynebacterium urogenitale]
MQLVALPYLDKIHAEKLVERTVKDMKSSGYIYVPEYSPKVYFPDTPLAQISAEAIDSLRMRVVETAQQYGFGSNEKNEYSAFDKALTPIIYHRLPLPVNEAKSPNVWNYLTTTVLLDVALWRFPFEEKISTLRRYYNDSLRNTFGRLWWRYHHLGELASSMGEDEFENLFGRSSIAGNPEISHLLFSIFDELAGTTVKSRMKSFREVATLLRFYSTTISFEALPRNELERNLRVWISGVLAKYRK